MWHDIRLGVRLLRKSPGFTLAAVASLGLGIGFNTSIFAVLDSVLLRPLPGAEPHRLVDIYTSGADGDTYATNSLPDLIDFRGQSQQAQQSPQTQPTNQAQVFEDVAGYTPMFTPLAAATGGGAGSDRVRVAMGEVVTGNYFTMLGVKARLGRPLMPADDIRNAPRRSEPAAAARDAHDARAHVGDAAAGDSRDDAGDGLLRPRIAAGGSRLVWRDRVFGRAAHA